MTPEQAREISALLLKLRGGRRQKDIAREAGTAQSTVCRAGQDASSVGAGSLGKVAAALGADLTGMLPPGYLVPDPAGWRGAAGTRLRELRAAKGWTQRRLAREAQVSRAVISFTEAGRRSLTAASAKALAAALETSPAELLPGPDDARGRAQ